MSITETELQALARVRDLLANECITYCDLGGRYAKLGDPISRLEDPQGEIEAGRAMFSMRTTGVEHNCGTVACIGGWMALLMGENSTEYVHSARHLASTGLRSLFFPRTESEVEWDGITPEEAVKAIDNFLATGYPHWSDVVAGRTPPSPDVTRDE